MKFYRYITSITLLFFCLGTKAQESVVDLTDNDTCAYDTLSAVGMTEIQPQRKPWIKRALSSIDKILSPPRDSNYIDVQNYNWCAMAQMSSRFEYYDIDSGKDFSMRVSPSTWRTRLGPFFGWRWAFLGYNIDLKSVFMNSKDTDMGASVYSPAFGIDLFYRRVGGDYTVKSLSLGGTDYSPLLKGNSFGGIKLGMTRISLYYVTNFKHYSHQAAFSQTNRQLQSAGSPIIGISYSHNRMNVDWDGLSKDINSISGNAVSFLPIGETQKNDELSISGGYGYNWVFAKNFLAACELTGAVGYLKHQASVTDKDEQNDDYHEDILQTIKRFYRKNIAFNGNARIALLYNNGPWFCGGQGVFFYYQYGNGNIMTRNLLGSLYLYVGCNF